MNYILFDSLDRDNLFPITYTRSISSIRVGQLTILEKWERYVNQQISILCPDYLSKKHSVAISAINIYVNGAVLPNRDLVNCIESLSHKQKLVQGNTLIACNAGALNWDGIIDECELYEAIEYNGELKQVRNTWDIISYLKCELQSDLKITKSDFQNITLPDYVTAINNDDILVGRNVKIGACIINAAEGPVVIDDGAEIMDGAIVKGPVYLGKRSVFKIGAKIYGPTSIGNNCKVGGEVTDSVFQAYSNKGHDGFLGHSYIGEWCNLGADTNTSNLKNTYEQVRIWNYATRRFDKTGLQFLGLIMGDHAKTGINTMLNTGSVIGVASNVYGAGFPRNFMPDFSAGGVQKIECFALNRVFKMATAMMGRRGIELSEDDKDIFSHVFSASSQYRNF